MGGKNQVSEEDGTLKITTPTTDTRQPNMLIGMVV